MRTLALLLLLWLAWPVSAQPKAKPKVDFRPNAATLQTIQQKTDELQQLLKGFETRRISRYDLADVQVYLKAAIWIVRHDEWLVKDAGNQTIRVLDAGIARAKQLAKGETPWRKVTGKPVIRGYFSEIDGSVQPYSVTLPDGFFEAKTPWRLDIVLHGRDGTLTEVKFIHAREQSKGSKVQQVIIEPYGRGNNAYRWAGENDVFSALGSFPARSGAVIKAIDPGKIILRGFSMGGAGAWHIGLHYPTRFAVVSPGAGFSTTHGYIGNLPAKLPDYQEKCLRIYDAVNYAENAFNVPIVAYSGALDKQKAAADNIENALKNFKEPVKFTHVVAPGLEHKLPPEWQAKLDVEYEKYLPKKSEAERVRFVTYTTGYHEFAHGLVAGLEQHYEKAIVDSRKDEAGNLTISTQNISSLILRKTAGKVVIDGQGFIRAQGFNEPFFIMKVDGRWQQQTKPFPVLRKGILALGEPALQGPIDDAFRFPFIVKAPTGKGFTSQTDEYVAASLKRFDYEWNRYMRGDLPTGPTELGNEVLFGDPASNPRIAELLPKLPIKWTKNELVMNGVTYDAKTHLPVMIYRHPERLGYVVLNSGHTFHEEDFKGTNALLYPRLGDWAVLKPTPTAKDPAAAEVIAAGLFDVNWQFEKK